MTEPTAVEVHDAGLPIARPEDLPEQFRDMAMTPEQFLKRRQALIELVKTQLVEATYGPRGKILRVNDFYRVPGSDKLALSRPGAGKLSDIYRVKPMEQKTDQHVYEQDHVMYRLITYVGRGGQVLGVGTGSCSTSEKRFQSPKSRKKYNATFKNADSQDGELIEVDPADYRAADHDVLTMASKRGYVNAIIDALSAHEVLQAADEYQHIPEGEAEEIKEAPRMHPEHLTAELLTRIMSLVNHAQHQKVLSIDEAEKFFKWIWREDRTTEQVEKQLDLLEDRIIQAEEGPIK